MVGDAPKFSAAIELARRAAVAGAPVLIQGETGVGRTLFVTLNCGAISADLFGSKLFGHAAGAFTSATRDGRPGKFEQADGGVLCLDEIGEVLLELQPYLLRVLEQRAVYRIGCSRRRQVDVQLIAMTNRDLEKEAAAGWTACPARDLPRFQGTMTPRPVKRRFLKSSIAVLMSASL